MANRNARQENLTYGAKNQVNYLKKIKQNKIYGKSFVTVNDPSNGLTLFTYPKIVDVGSLA